MEEWKKSFESILAKKLESAVADFRSKEVKVLDIGIFPWYSSIELSFLLSSDYCDQHSVADWPYYDYTKFNEGQWPEIVAVAKHLNAVWRQGRDIVGLLKEVAAATKSTAVTEQLEKFLLAPNFEVQILNPDDFNSPNYYH